MIKILEQSPIVFNGSERVELLVCNTDGCDNPCAYCCYNGFEPDDDLDSSCGEIHGCDDFSDSYFIIA